MLDQSTTRLAERVADDINGSLTLGFGLVIERNVGHLLARIEERILGCFGEDVLGSTHEYGSEQGGEADSGQGGGQNIREEHQGEEDDTSDQEDGRSDESSHSPTEPGEDPARDKHHRESDSTGGGGEITHEGRVVVRVRELSFNLRFPGNLDQVDGDTIGHD